MDRKSGIQVRTCLHRPYVPWADSADTAHNTWKPKGKEPKSITSKILGFLS